VLYAATVYRASIGCWLSRNATFTLTIIADQMCLFTHISWRRKMLVEWPERVAVFRIRPRLSLKTVAACVAGISALG
jgi:hypothetical protein